MLKLTRENRAAQDRARLRGTPLRLLVLQDGPLALANAKARTRAHANANAKSNGGLLEPSGGLSGSLLDIRHPRNVTGG